MTRIVRRNREERRRECENPDAGSRVTGYFDAFVERVPTQRGFNYADITVIKPINACHCAASGGPNASPGSYPQSRPRASSATSQKHHTLRGNTRTHPVPVVESSPRPPRRRGKATTKNGEENKHSDSLDPVGLDDTQTLGLLPATRTSDAKNHRGRSNGSLTERLFRSIVRVDPMLEFNGEEQRFARHCFYAPQSS